jgi:hypothetical protein
MLNDVFFAGRMAGKLTGTPIGMNQSSLTKKSEKGLLAGDAEEIEDTYQRRAQCCRFPVGPPWCVAGRCQIFV